MATIQYMGHTTQHDGESIAYTVDTSNFDGPVATLSTEVLLVKDEADAAVTEDNSTDVTGTVASGSPAAAGDVLTTAVYGSMTIGQTYRCYSIFDDANGNGPFRRYFEIECIGES